VDIMRVLMCLGSDLKSLHQRKVLVVGLVDFSVVCIGRIIMLSLMALSIIYRFQQKKLLLATIFSFCGE
jgi:hypothetical protein